MKPQCYKQNCQNRNTYSEHISPTLQLILLGNASDINNEA